MAARPILYIAPQPPTVGGIADYAARFREALDAAKIGYHDIAPPADFPSRDDVVAIRRDVVAHANSGEYDKYRLAHIEIARFSYREYWYAHYLRKYAKLPIILTLHEPLDILERPFRHLGLETKPKPVRVVRKVLDENIGKRQKKALVNEASRILTLGDYGQSLVRSAWSPDPTKLRSIPHVSYESIRRKAPRKQLEIVFAGFYGQHKGLETLLEAYKRLLDRKLKLKTRLVVTGADFAPGHHSGLQEVLDASGLTDTQLDRRGFLTERELQELFAGAAAAVVPYEAGLPAASSAMLLRALSAGTPTVVSDLPSLTQDVTDGKTALVFRAGDAPDLSEKLRRLLGSASLRTKLGRAAAAETKKQRSPQAVGKVISKIYGEVAE